MEKHRWEKAEIKLRKSLHKDTVNVSIRYLLSTYYFSPGNPKFNLDSAYHYAVTALADFEMTSAKERDKLKRIPVDSLRLIAIREKIDSAGFQLAKNRNTEAAYIEFLSHHKSASQRHLATELRDEVAYQQAVSESTHEAFLGYLHRYPGAARAAEARQHYERLLYFYETQDLRLSSFEKFLVNHPATPYRPQILRHIFELFTVDGTVQSFVTFMERYPTGDFVKRAGQILFHLLAEDERAEWPMNFLNDSLRNVQRMQSAYLVPVLKNSLFGFMDEKGQQVIPPEFETIHPSYLCGNVTDEILILDNKLIGRNGSIVYEGRVEEVTELGIGFLKIKTGNHIKLIHKAGFIFADSIEDARILNRRYIGVQSNGSWHLYSLSGRRLNKEGWEDILAIGDVIILKRENKLYMCTSKQLGNIAHGSDFKLSEPFDDVRTWPHNLIWVKSGEFEGVLNQTLKIVMRFDKHVLKQTFFGATAAVPDGTRLYNWAGQESPTFEKVNIHSPWVAVRKHESWHLFEPHLQEIESRAYDTIGAEGPFVIGTLTDTIYVHFALSNRKIFVQPNKISFVPGKDSTSFLLIEDQDEMKSLYDIKGKKLFSMVFDGIEYAGDGIFVISKKDKKGLINSFGRLLLPAEFDAIGSVKDKVVSVLKAKRFGSYHTARERFIKPQYDRNLTPYTDQILLTYKDGFYGFLLWDNKPLSKFEFDEIRYWEDSVALVRKGTLWHFYDIAAKELAEENLRNVLLVKNSTDEKVAIIQNGNSFGVMSNKKNLLIPSSFSDIINLGSEETPLYFTEKHITEASVYIVIYYDHTGKMLRKEIYEDAADYDKIYCSDH